LSSLKVTPRLPVWRAPRRALGNTFRKFQVWLGCTGIIYLEYTTFS